MRIILDKCYDIIKKFALKNIKLKDDSYVLDIGCGLKGNFWGFKPKAYFGLDNNPKITEKNTKNNNGNYKLYDVCQGLPFANKSFDYVISVSFFHHLSDEQAKQLIIQIKRTLKANGRAIMVDGVFPQSKSNIIGYLLRFFDRGRYVRKASDFEALFVDEFNIEEKYGFTEKIFAYTALLLRPKND
ncbi:MAG: class I SAM-dependent methyltransferase [Candidatus Omnitrophica bacterium]|nr:class I SAM-dependent methyltransferase [Candidatus Omnitrophota bacterium]